MTGIAYLAASSHVCHFLILFYQPLPFFLNDLYFTFLELHFSILNPILSLLFIAFCSYFNGASNCQIHPAFSVSNTLMRTLCVNIQ